MIGLKLFTVFCLAGFLLPESEGFDWPALRVKYSSLDLLRRNSFFELPLTKDEAIKDEYVEPEETKVNNKTTTLCRKKDASSCVIYDGKGNIAAYQIAIPAQVDKLNMGIDYTTKGFDRVTLFGEDWYATQARFVDQDVIDAGGREYDGQIGTGLWLKFGDTFKEMPRKESDIASKVPELVKQNCFKSMGQHYFINVTRNLTVADYKPFFILYEERELVGFGLVVFGSKAVEKSWWNVLPFVGERDWFEFLPSFAVRLISKDSPDWVLDYINKYGPFSHHVYFIDKPWKITCP